MPVQGYTPFYDEQSHYRFTPLINKYLTYYVHRQILPNELDRVFTINDERYVNRPDILAFDLYGDPDLWWVFGVRNGFEDPVHNIKLGSSIIISDISYIRSII